jgi:hypothetical protein
VATTPFPWTDFNGLDLRAEADSTGGAIDGVNFDLDKVGAVRTRDGYGRLNLTAKPVDIVSGPFPTPNSIIVSGSDGKFYVSDTAGAAIDASASSYTAITSTADFGTPSSTATYIATGITSFTIVKYVFGVFASTFSQPAGMPKAEFLAVQPSDNRLVAARLDSGVDRVAFSDPGDAETFGANNYVLLSPHDGQNINGMAVWGDSLFVFKQRKFFVFYGNSTDGSGNPIFNYRTIDTGIGLATEGGPVIPTADGLYFVSADGVYRTQGGPPTKVSAALDPLFQSSVTLPFCTIRPRLASIPYGAAVVRNRLYIPAQENSGAGNKLIFVYDIASGEWGVWQPTHTPVGGLANLRSSTSSDRVCFASGPYMYAFSPASTTDDGAGISARWRSPYTYPAVSRQQGRLVQVPDQEVIVRESILNGVGTVGYSMASNWATALPTSAGGAKQLVKLGATVPKEGRHRKSQRGRTMSFQIETPTASDDFSSNTIANYTADQGLTSNVSITGGKMVGAANLSNQTRLALTTGTFTDFGDSVSTLKVTVGGTLANFLAGRMLKRIDSSNALFVRISDSGSASTLSIAKNVAGVTSDVASQALTRLTTTTTYWIRARIEGNVITAEHFTADPATNVAPASTTYTLTGSEATTFGAGVVGKTGVSFTPQHASASLDDSSVIGGAWKVEDVTMQLTGFRAPALQTA